MRGGLRVCETGVLMKITEAKQLVSEVSTALGTHVPEPLKEPGGWWWAKLGLRLVYYAGACALLQHSAQAWPFGATFILALGVAVLGVLMHRFWLTHEVGDNALALKIFVWTVIIEIGVAICLSQHWRVLGFYGFIGLSFIAFGAGQLSAEIRAAQPLLFSAMNLFGVNVIVALVLSAGLGFGGWMLLIGALVGAYPTISFGSEYFLNKIEEHWDITWRNHLILGGLGLAAAILGAVLILPVGGWRFSIVVVVLVALLVLMIASNTDADMLFVVFAAAVIWSQMPRGDALPPAFDPKVPNSILVLGDSYISGEGARNYLHGTNVHDGDRRNECRRSEKAWALRVQAEMQWNLDFLACSGAKGIHILDRGQYAGENPSGFVPSDFSEQCKANAETVTDPRDPCVLSQLELYDTLKRTAKPDFVFVSIGGNDAGFGDLVAACLSPGDCSAGGQRWLDGLTTRLVPVLDAVYSELYRRFGDRAVVVPYPIPISDKGCQIFNSTFTDSEHKFLNGFTTQMDNVIELSAAQHGLRFVKPMRTVFEENNVRICDTDAAAAAVNYFALNPVGGDVDPTGWVHNSMHPKESGHELMASVVSAWIAAPTSPEKIGDVEAPSLCMASITSGGTESCPPADSQATSQPTVDATPDFGPEDARSRVFAAVLIVVGMWMVALAALSRRRIARSGNPARWTIAKWLDGMTKKSQRLVACAVVLVAFAAFLVVLGWTVGLANGYGSAQYETAKQLKDRPTTDWYRFRESGWRDFAFYVPAYAIFGLTVLRSVKPVKATVSQRKWVRRAVGALAVLAAADFTETGLFLRSLHELIDSAGDIGTLTTLTRVASAVKYVSAAVAVLLLCRVIYDRGSAGAVLPADGDDQSDVVAGVA
jgi:GDSL-like Lipase/Acylhydrolase family